VGGDDLKERLNIVTKRHLNDAPTYPPFRCQLSLKFLTAIARKTVVFIIHSKNPKRITLISFSHTSSLFLGLKGNSGALIMFHHLSPDESV